MATYTIYGNSADSYIRSGSTTYATARSGANLTVYASTDTVQSIGQLISGSTYFLYEGYFSFDTSSVLGSVQSVTLDLYLDADGSATDFTVNARAYDWGTSVGSGDWVAGASLSSSALRATLDTTGLSAGAYKTFTSDSTFAENTANPVRLILSSSRMEGVSGNAPTGNEYMNFTDSSYTGTDRDPKLTIITYDPPVFANMAPRIAPERMD